MIELQRKFLQMKKKEKTEIKENVSKRKKDEIHKEN